MTTTAIVPRRAGLAALLAALSMFGPFSIDTMFPAFPNIAADFGASAVAMQQTISVYLIAYALMSLLHGPLSDSVGRRPVILGGVAVFALASVGCALATSMPQLLAFRAVQGMSAGAGLIVGRAIVRDYYDGAEAQRLMSHIMMIFGVAPALAPMIGGWILLWSNWHMIFGILALFALLLWLLCLPLLPETHAPARRVPFSTRSLLVNCRNIMVDAQFLPLALSGTFNFAALFIYIASAPAFVLGLLRLNAQQFTWLFIPAISGMMLGSFLSGRLAGRVSAAQTVNLGYAIMLVAGGANVALNLALPQPALPWVVLPIGLGAIGISLCFPTLTLLILDRFPAHRGAASSLQAFVSLGFCALLAGVVAPLLADSTLHLALAAMVLTVLGFITWRWYRRVGKRELAAHVGASLDEVVCEAEPVEPA